MSDITALVKRLRGYNWEYADVIAAAAALEAQAKEIRIYQQTEQTYVVRVADMQREYSEMQAKLEARIAERIAEQDYVLEMKWRAEHRAIKAWQERTGEHLTWPDQAKLVEWLMDELHAARAALKREK